MKTRFKKILALAIAFALSVTMLFGGGVLSAVATDANVTAPAAQGSFNVPGTFYYGQTWLNADMGLTANSSLVVTAPNGDATAAITQGGLPFTFSQLGVHRVDFFNIAAPDLTNTDVTLRTAPIFTTTVVVNPRADFQLRVAYGGATIPTVWPYVPVGDGVLGNNERIFELPAASLFYQTEDMNAFEPSSTNYTLNVIISPAQNVQMSTYTPVSDGDGTWSNFTNIPLDGRLDFNARTRIRFNRMGTFTVQYVVAVEGGDVLDANHIVSESFQVRVQGRNTGDNAAAPTLIHAGVPSQASLNTRVNLPVVTANDPLDDNVQVLVTVRHAETGDYASNVYVDTRTGFAFAEASGTVHFDNVWTTYFYPTRTGRYIVSYTAVNDFGVTGGFREFDIWVEDRTAPVLVNFNENAIPTRWGVEVQRIDYIDQDGEVVRDVLTGNHQDLYIHIPFPEFIDNGAGFVRNAADTGYEWNDNILSVVFEIRDTVSNRTVLRFNNIFDQPRYENGSWVGGAGSLATSNYYTPSDNSFSMSYAPGTSAVQNQLRFTENGFYFNFYHYVAAGIANTHSDFSGFDGLGRYTFQFQARDVGRQNISTRTFDVTLEQIFEDLEAPRIAPLDDLRPILISQDTTTFSVPTAVITDNVAGRINVEYRIYIADSAGVRQNAANPMLGRDFIEVTNGELLTIYRGARHGTGNGGDSGTWLRNASFADFLNNPRFDQWDYPNQITVRNAYQNELSLNIANATHLLLDIIATDYVGNSTRDLRERTGFGATDFAPYDGNFDPVLVRIVNADSPTLTGAAWELNTDDINTGTTVNIAETDGLGSFTITGVPADYRNFVGFELKLQDSDGNIEALSNLETFFNAGTITVQNIRASLRAGDYTLFIRAFDVSGRSQATTVDFTVAGGAGGGNNVVITSAARPIGATGQVRNTYILRNENMNVDENAIHATNRFIVRQIQNATHFSLMGSEFTAYTVGSFTFNEGHYNLAGNLIFPANAHPVNFTDAASTIDIFVHGVVPIHSERVVRVGNHWRNEGSEDNLTSDQGWIILPRVTAHNGLQQTVPTIELTNPNGTPVTAVSYEAATRNPLDLSTPIPLAQSSALLVRMADGSYRFRPSMDGEYRVRFRAAVGQAEPRFTDFFTIRVGSTAPVPVETIGDHASTMALNARFDFLRLQVNVDNEAFVESNVSNFDTVRVRKRLILPNGNVAVEISEMGLLNRRDGTISTNRTMTAALEEDGFILRDAGEYRVEYIVDIRQAGQYVNQYMLVYTFSVAGAPVPPSVPLQVIAVVLVIVGSLAIAALILYVMRFRKKKIKA